MKRFICYFLSAWLLTGWLINVGVAMLFAGFWGGLGFLGIALIILHYVVTFWQECRWGWLR